MSINDQASAPGTALALPAGWAISVNTSEELEITADSLPGSPYVNIQPGRRGCDLNVRVRSEGAPSRVIAHAISVWVERIEASF